MQWANNMPMENPTLLVLNLTPNSTYVSAVSHHHVLKILGSSTGVSGCDLLQCRHFCLRKSWGVANRCEALGRAAGDSTGASSSVGHGSKSPLASGLRMA
jgi:hypothetical protein